MVSSSLFLSASGHRGWHRCSEADFIYDEVSESRETTTIDMMTPILFLDIDGVLLTGRAWLMPVNAEARRLLREGRQQLIEAAKMVRFDPLAVNLAVRLCEQAGAKLVIASNWRHTVGPAATKAKLVDQGIPEALFHPDYACPVLRRGPRGKATEIWRWLDSHRTTPMSERPEATLADPGGEEAWAVWHALQAEPGFPFAVLDDEGEVEGLPAAIPLMLKSALTWWATGQLWLP